MYFSLIGSEVMALGQNSLAKAFCNSHNANSNAKNCSLGSRDTCRSGCWTDYVGVNLTYFLLLEYALIFILIDNYYVMLR